jgi:hypothetical protein
MMIRLRTLLSRYFTNPFTLMYGKDKAKLYRGYSSGSLILVRSVKGAITRYGDVPGAHDLSDELKKDFLLSMFYHNCEQQTS